MPVYRLPVTITDTRAGKCTNVWHFRTVADSTVGDEAIKNCVLALRQFYVTNASILVVGATVTADFAVDVETGAEKAVTWAPVAGSQPTPACPPHLSVCISWKTSIRGRRARGRTFLGPHGLGAIDADGTVQVLTLNQVKTSADALVAASLADNGWAIGVWGQQDAMKGASSQARAEAPHVLRDIRGWSCSDKFAVMRSRRPR